MKELTFEPDLEECVRVCLWMKFQSQRAGHPDNRSWVVSQGGIASISPPFFSCRLVPSVVSETYNLWNILAWETWSL